MKYIKWILAIIGIAAFSAFGFWIDAKRIRYHAGPTVIDSRREGVEHKPSDIKSITFYDTNDAPHEVVFHESSVVTLEMLGIDPNESTPKRLIQYSTDDEQNILKEIK